MEGKFLKRADTITEHLNELAIDMEHQFRDVIELNFPLWLSQPFLVDCLSEDVRDVSADMVEELLELQGDQSTKTLFDKKGLMMWLEFRVASKFAKLIAVAQKALLPFPTTYLVECGFSTVSDILTKKRGRLQITDRGDLRLKLTSFDPDIDELVKGHSAQGSH